MANDGWIYEIASSIRIKATQIGLFDGIDPRRKKKQNKNNFVAFNLACILWMQFIICKAENCGNVGRQSIDSMVPSDNYSNGWLGKIIINRLSNTDPPANGSVGCFSLSISCCRHFGFGSDFELHLFFFLSAQPIQCDAMLIQIALRKCPFVHWPMFVLTVVWWISMFFLSIPLNQCIWLHQFEYLSSTSKGKLASQTFYRYFDKGDNRLTTEEKKHKNWFFVYFIFLLRHINIISTAYKLTIDFNMNLKTNNLYTQ